MSYPKDLDEYTDQELEDELHVRRLSASNGVCSYCKRLGSSDTCRFPDRHELARLVLVEKSKLSSRSSSPIM